MDELRNLRVINPQTNQKIYWRTGSLFDFCELYFFFTLRGKERRILPWWYMEYKISSKISLGTFEWKNR